MCLHSLQCRFRWGLNEHSRPSDHRGQGGNSTPHGSHSKHSHPEEWWTHHRSHPRFPHDILPHYLQRRLLHSPTVHWDPFLVHWCKWVHRFASPNNSQACHFVDWQASNQFSASTQSFFQSRGQLQRKRKDIYWRIAQMPQGWLGAFQEQWIASGANW